MVAKYLKRKAHKSETCSSSSSSSGFKQVRVRLRPLVDRRGNTRAAVNRKAALFLIGQKKQKKTSILATAVIEFSIRGHTKGAGLRK